MEGDVYFTDGPSVYKKKNGQLVILWSSWGENGYTVGQTVSESGNIQGPWTHVDKPVFERDWQVDGMIFETIEGEREIYVTLSKPKRRRASSVYENRRIRKGYRDYIVEKK